MVKIHTAPKIDLLHSAVIGTLILTFPYSISNATVGTLAILSFLIMIYQKSFNLSKISKNHVIVALFTFIVFTYISTLWSSVSIFNEHSDFNTSINRFKYYFLIIPSIYFSNFSKQTIKRFFWLIAIAPLPLVLIYYLNSFDYISYYSIHHSGTSTYIASYLEENIFILFSSIFLFIQLLFSLKKREFFYSTVLAILFLLIALSLFIDPKTSSRLVNTVFVLTISISIFYVFKTKYILPLVLLVLTISFFILLKGEKFKHGVNEFKKALTEKEFKGSWGHRTAYATIGMNIFLKNPIFGSGINDVTTEINAFKISDPHYFIGEENMRRLHNDHLLILGQVGIVGYALFIYFIYLFLRTKLSNKKIEIFKNLFLLSFIFLMLGEHYLMDKYSTNLLAVVVALSMLYKRLDSEESILATKGTDKNEKNIVYS